jgi:hypothetical protein
MLVQQMKGIDTMNCLKCENFWKTDIDEAKCDKCGCGAETNKAKEEGRKKDEKAHSLPG